MIRASEVQNSRSDNDKLFLLRIDKASSQRIIAVLDNYPVSEPLPKLLLGSPVLLAVLTQNESIILLLLGPTFLFQLLFIVYFHIHSFQQTRLSSGKSGYHLIPITHTGNPQPETRVKFSSDQCLRTSQPIPIPIAIAVPVTIPVPVTISGRDFHEFLVERVNDQLQATVHL